MPFSSTLASQGWLNHTPSMTPDWSRSTALHDVTRRRWPCSSVTRSTVARTVASSPTLRSRSPCGREVLVAARDSARAGRRPSSGRSRPAVWPGPGARRAARPAAARDRRRREQRRVAGGRSSYRPPREAHGSRPVAHSTIIAKANMPGPPWVPTTAPTRPWKTICALGRAREQRRFEGRQLVVGVGAPGDQLGASSGVRALAAAGWPWPRARAARRAPWRRR